METFATLDVRNRVKNRLADLRMPAIVLAQLARMPASRINLALRKMADWSPKDAQALLDLTMRLQELRDGFEPLALDMSNAESLSLLLDHMDTNGLSPSDVRQIVQTIFRTK